jgi:hypothetical protein
MAFNHRFLLRFITNIAVYLLLFSCFGVVLWVVDEIIGWDILPDAWSLLVRACLVAGGIIAFVLVVINIILSLALVAEAQASRAALPDFQIARQLKRRFKRSFVALGLVVALLVAGLQVADRFRSATLARATRNEFAQVQTETEASLDKALDLFPPELLSALAQNQLDQSQLSSLRKLLGAISNSFPHRPTVAMLLPAAAPYQYSRIDQGSIASNQEGKLYLAPQFYTAMPSDVEDAAIKALFEGKPYPVDEVMQGAILNNTLPSAWGVLKHSGEVVAVVYLQADYPIDYDSSLHHDGPEKLLSNG